MVAVKNANTTTSDNNRTIKDSEAEDYFKNNEWRDGLSYCNALLGRSSYTMHIINHLTR